MNNYLLHFAFQGSHFKGTQRQKDEPTVQQCLEERLSMLCGSPVKFNPCSRLDSGVSALRMAGNFKCERRMETAKLKYVLNRLLPPYLRILDAEEVPLDFNARFDAVKKTYLYLVDLSREISPFDCESVFYPYYRVDSEIMSAAAQLMRGEHNFRLFASPEAAENTVQTVDAADAVKRGDRLEIRVSGKKFLRYQVRFMVGAMLDAGAGRLALSDIAERLAGLGAGKPRYKAPAHALYLEEVVFDRARSARV